MNLSERKYAEDGDGQDGAGRAEEAAETDVVDDAPQEWRQHHGHVVHGARVVRWSFSINTDHELTMRFIITGKANWIFPSLFRFVLGRKLEVKNPAI